MKIKNKLFWTVIPVVFIPSILSSAVILNNKNNNISAIQNAVTDTPTTPIKPPKPAPGEVLQTTVKPGKNYINAKDISPIGTKQFEMDYTVNLNNPNFEGLELLSNYFERNYRDIFDSIPGWTKENTIQLVMIKNGVNTGINARVTFQGWDQFGHLQNNLVRDFKIIFEQPPIDKVVIRIKSILETYRNNWPASWSETVINQFFSQISQGISNVIAFNPDSFPEVINKDNQLHPTNPPVKYDLTKIRFNKTSIEMDANAISLIPAEYANKGSDVKPINISVDLNIQKLATQSFLEKNGWIIVILPVGIITFIIFLLVALFYSKRKMKKIDNIDRTWGF